MYKIIILIDNLPDFLQKARNISLYKNLIVLCKNNKCSNLKNFWILLNNMLLFKLLKK